MGLVNSYYIKTKKIIFKDLLHEIKDFKYQITVNFLLVR